MRKNKSNQQGHFVWSFYNAANASEVTLSVYVPQAKVSEL